MKFDIYKVILALCAITICLQIVSSLHTKSRLGSKMNLGIKSGMKTKANMHMKTKSNYKFALKNHVEKSLKTKAKSSAKSNSKTNVKTNSKKDENNKEPESKILFRGWMKYFKFPDDETSKKPKNFFKNPMFEKDARRKHAVGEVKII